MNACSAHRTGSSLISDAPRLWIVAGPNGSGKSSAYSLAAFDEPKGSVWIINPDLLAERIRTFESLDPLSANLQAVIRIERWLRSSIRAHQTVGVETVLSTDKYRRLVHFAKRHGYVVHLVFVALRDVELNIERVRLRVAKGGHDVPAEKIVDRRRRSFEQLPWFLLHADQADIFDNSGDHPILVARKSGELMTILKPLFRELQVAIGGRST